MREISSLRLNVKRYVRKRANASPSFTILENVATLKGEKSRMLILTEFRIIPHLAQNSAVSEEKIERPFRFATCYNIP